MIAKVLRIKNVGQFADYACQGQTDLARLSLIYAENARGKTTLSAVCRSLAAGDATPIAERKRLASAEGPYVEIRLSDGNAIFSNGAWNQTVPDVVVFDDEFVCRNVFAGLGVTLEQRRNLHRVVIGPRGIELATRIEDLDRQSRETAHQIHESEAQIRPVIRRSATVEDFCRLQPQDNLDQAITDKRRQLEAARSAEAIGRQADFSAVTFPDPRIDELRDLLARSIADLSAEAVDQVEAHFRRLGPGGESWAADGMPRIVDEQCPFCAQDVSHVLLVRHFRAYFSAAYERLRADIRNAQDQLRRTLGGDALAAIVQRFATLQDLRRFWVHFVPIDEVAFPVDEIRAAWISLRDRLVAVLEQKASRPLEPILWEQDIVSRVTAFRSVAHAVGAASDALQRHNLSIQQLKAGASATNAAAIEAEINHLLNIQARHNAPLSQVCVQHLSLLAAKRHIERDKEQTRDELDRYTAAIFRSYQIAINDYLHRFNADFQIADVAADHAGGRPGSRYHIIINETPVQLGDENTPPGTVCFRNTLSAGDRSALALAFFLAQLDQEPHLNTKVVLFDDPISSFDDHRRSTTQQIICRLAERTAQVIVMSHSALFLRSIWDHRGAPDASTLKIAPAAQGSAIQAWDIETEVTAEQFKLYTILCNYSGSNEGAVCQVATAIRPFLEGWLRVTYPDVLRPGEWAGDFLCRAREAQDAGRPIVSRDERHILEDIVQYANRYHHNINPTNWQTEPVNEKELLGFVRQALDLVRRPPPT
jgi:wobble nucleotide-excising tRNase